MAFTRVLTANGDKVDNEEHSCSHNCLLSFLFFYFFGAHVDACHRGRINTIAVKKNISLVCNLIFQVAEVIIIFKNVFIHLMTLKV